MVLCLAVPEVVGSTDVVHDNRYDLPELTNGQITGLIGDSPLEVGRLFSSSFSQASCLFRLGAEWGLGLERREIVCAIG